MKSALFAAPFLIGSWFGTGQPDDKAAMWIAHMGANGGFAAQFRSCVKGKEVDEIQELYLSGKKDEACAVIPTALIEELSLIGPREKIRDDLAKWRESVVTTLLISGDAATLRAAAELVLG